MNNPVLRVSMWDTPLAEASLSLGDSGIVAIVNPGWKLSPEQYQPGVQALHTSPWNVACIPLWEWGSLLWSEVSPVISLMATVPGASAALLVKGPCAETTLGDLWQRLIQQSAEQLLVLPGVTGLSGAGPELPLLAPGRARTPGWFRSELQRVCQGTDRVASLALQAGLWQLHDELENSHQCSQQIEGAGRHRTGDYWHAIMHRREPDYGNSKYWFRRVGQHPIMADLARQVRGLGGTHSDPDSRRWIDRLSGSGWNAMAFVDLCEEASQDEGAPLGHLARTIQLQEMTLLLRFSSHEFGG